MMCVCMRAGVCMYVMCVHFVCTVCVHLSMRLCLYVSHAGDDLDRVRPLERSSRMPANDVSCVVVRHERPHCQRRRVVAVVSDEQHHVVPQRRCG